VRLRDFPSRSEASRAGADANPRAPRGLSEAPHLLSKTARPVPMPVTTRATMSTTATTLVFITRGDPRACHRCRTWQEQPPSCRSGPGPCDLLVPRDQPRGVKPRGTALTTSTHHVSDRPCGVDRARPSDRVIPGEVGWGGRSASQGRASLRGTAPATIRSRPTRRQPLPANTSAVASHCTAGTFAPTLMLVSTSEVPSAFITTTDQAP
jgi:hypothetical protein